MNAVKRRDCLGLVAALCCVAAAADPAPAEQARIDKLIVSVSQRSDIKFIRSGKQYSCTEGFLREEEPS